MLRRLFLGQPRRDEIKDGKKEICEEEKRTPIAFMKESTANNLEEKHEAKDDIFDSDSETDSSEAEDSDAETLDNSSRTGSYEDCSGDVLGWKGFEMVRDTQRGQIGSSKSNGGTLEIVENPKGQENPFANAFQIQENEMPHIHDKTKSEIINNDEHNNDEHNNDNNNNNTRSKTNNKQTHQAIDNETATITATTTTQTRIASTKDRKDPTKSTKNIKNNINDNKKQISNSKQKINKTRQTKFDQPKTTLQFPKPSTTNQKPPNIKAKGISRHYSIRENQHTSSIKGQTTSRINTGSKTISSTNKPGKGPKAQNSGSKTISSTNKPGKGPKAQNSLTGCTSASVDTKWHQVIGKDKTGLRGTRIGNKGKQGNLNSTHVSVQDLETILGVNLTELKEVIKTYKSEKISTAGDCQGQNDAAQGSPGMVGDNLVDRKNSQDECKEDETKERKSETLDNKDEVSSDSGVSEPDAHSTCSQPHYITLKAIVKRKEYLEGQIRKLVDHVVVIGDHKRDIQFVHDLFDLHSDGLAKVERSNGGVACVTNLKRILACQLREIDEEEFRAKLKSLEDLGIPNFSEINARIEKLRKRIRHTLDDERKCRSKGVQKLRFEVGKVQGMCEAVLDLVYTE